MKNVLLYNYNLSIENINELDDGSFSFYIDYEKYYMTKLTRPKEDIQIIFEMLANYKNTYHTMYKNRFGSLFTEFDNASFILIKVNGPENMEIDIHDMIKEAKEIKKIEDNSKVLDRRDWNTLWTQKVDYLEYQISELGKNYPIIRCSFSYYIGLAENAITYINLLKLGEAPITLSHRRISSPINSLSYKNPLDLVIDYRVRDFSEYFKTKFFNDSNVIEEIKYLTNKNILSPLEYNLLFARLLYPTYYFDEIYEILEKGKDENVLLRYIEKINSYEKFLNDVYSIFSKKSSMIKIDWLIKKS